ncbi:CHUP1-like protein [Citrus sinensis]|uniref:CHUP1-like protein n=1 Tax=Citrus sinensis TaxID=2711 RepID=A0ACB8IX51_CITSI|nr:CHUP1-like protein [Citrus sinensis]
MAPEDDDSRIDSFQKERDARIALLEKENFELRQEVLRLKAQISSLKAHDNERKSMLWKKLQNPNTDTSPQKQTDFVKTQEFQNLDGETFRPRPGFQELEAGKERSIKVPKPPPRHTSENKVQTPVAFPAPPPPPLPSKFLAGSKTVRRVPEVVELYRSLTRKDAHMENRSNTTAAPAIAFTRNMIGEIENRSTYLSAIKTDVKKQKEFINFLIKEVESAVFDQISEVEAFVKWLDGELSSLVDERAVLKHFPQWPERKADALREAACNYRDLKNLEQEMKVSSLRLAKEYMKRVSKELQSSECWREDNLMLQGVRFAYRVHQIRSIAYNWLTVDIEKWSGFNLAEFSLISISLPLSSSISSPFIAAVPRFHSPSIPLFRVVAAPHGILTATLWANVGSRVSLNGSGKSATVVIL